MLNGQSSAQRKHKEVRGTRDEGRGKQTMDNAESTIFRAAEDSFLLGISGMQRRKIPKITIHNILFYRKLKKTNRILDKP
jgi:hypothetical protein